MRLYSFVVLIELVLAARAASIPDNTQASQENLKSIQKLRESFITRIDTLTENIQNFINGNRNNASPAGERTKNDLQNIKSGLNTIKNDFTKEIQILIDNIESKALYRILERSNTSSDAGKFIQTFITNFDTHVQNGLATVTNSFNNYLIQDQNAFNQGQQASIDSTGSVEVTMGVAPVESPSNVSPAEATAPTPSLGAPVPLPPAETQADFLSLIPSIAGLTPGVSELISVVHAVQALQNVFNRYVKSPIQSIEKIGAQTGTTLLQDNHFNQRINTTIHTQNQTAEKPQELEKVKALSAVLFSENEKKELNLDSGKYKYPELS